MCLTIIRLELDGGLKIFRGFFRLLQGIKHIPAVHISRGHFRVALQGPSEISQRLFVLAFASVNVTFDQRQVTIVGKNRIVLRREIERFLIASQVIQIVGEIDRGLAVARKPFDHLEAQIGCFLILGFPGQVALPLAHYIGIVIHRSFGPVQPGFGQFEVMRLKRCIGRARDDQRVGLIMLVCGLIAGLSFIENSLRGIEIT